MKKPSAHTNRAPSPRRPPASSSVFALGTGSLVVASAAALVLVLQHFGGLALPGCGAGSPCAQAAASPWGKVPGIGWPVSFVGLAYFLGALSGWVIGRGAVGTGLLWMARVGGLFSFTFVVAMVVERLFCPYCFAAHAGNLSFVLAVYRSHARNAVSNGAPAGTPKWQFAIASCVFIFASFALGVVDSQHRAQALAKAERDRKQTESALTKPPTPTAVTPPVPAPIANPAPVASAVFTGRYRWGPDVAAIRIVMLTDYQCPDCLKIEEQLSALMKRDLSLSVSIKYFPLSNKCNPNAPGDMHANACWAARAAETAGILRGTDGFWEMHHWLFSKRGSFTDGELRQGLAEMGYDAGVFESTMQSPLTLQRVQEDIKEGMDLGLHYTPMIFINGVELKGWNAPDALTRTVEAVVATNPAPLPSSADHPPGAAERMLADWREQPVRTIPQSVFRRSMGPPDAKIHVVLFGDYLEPFCAEADGLLRVFTDGPEPRIRYTFAHFPINKSCNPSTQITKFESCLAHRAAEAGDILAGPDAFWRIHDWLMSHQKDFSIPGLKTAAMSWDFDASTIEDAMQLPEVQEHIVSDCTAAASLGVQSLPMIFINGKYVPRWKAGNENILPRIFAEAAENPPPAR